MGQKIESVFNGVKTVTLGTSDKQERDTLARSLRKDGFTVKTSKWDFTDLARGAWYTLKATKEGF